jgi:C-terminal processing protease CtpA/Prc
MYYFDGVIEVGDVMENSPAEKAGFLPGDVIISIDNLISGTIQEYKNKMQYPGQKVRVVISRNGSLEVLTMKIGNILKRK